MEKVKESLKEVKTKSKHKYLSIGWQKKAEGTKEEVKNHKNFKIN